MHEQMNEHEQMNVNLAMYQTKVRIVMVNFIDNINIFFLIQVLKSRKFSGLASIHHIQQTHNKTFTSSHTNVPIHFIKLKPKLIYFYFIYTSL